MIASNTDRVQCPYDVGDVLITASDTQPSARWPGTVWEQIKDVFPLAAGDKHVVGETGGEESVALKGENNGLHSHGIYTVYAGVDHGAGNERTTINAGWSSVYLEAGAAMTNAGEGKPHNNMPPYKSYYMWERTA